jgi:Glycosyl transferase family 90
MPDFGYWSWPEIGMSSYSKFRRRVRAMDEGIREDGSSIGRIEFQSKKQQLVWRGALRPNPLRGKLYDLAKGKMWADVQYINWDDERDVNHKVMQMEEFCRYAFLGHVEGRSYSGRAKYLLNCRSVFVSHKLEWVEAHHGALVKEGPEQNYVEIRRDWANLEDEIMHLIEHPELAERIAENSVKTFRDRYLTPAAEACYWRRLIRGWASVSFEPQFYKDEERERWRGVPFESFVLTNTT